MGNFQERGARIRQAIVRAILAFTLGIPASIGPSSATQSSNGDESLAYAYGESSAYAIEYSAPAERLAQSVVFSVSLPPVVYCEPGEDIAVFSRLPADSEWHVVPGEIASWDGAKLRGAKEGTAFFIGRGKGIATLLPVVVKRLTPDEHDILVSLRAQLSQTNLYKNHLDSAQTKLVEARSKRMGLATRYTDFTIREASLSKECQAAYDAMKPAFTAYLESRMALLRWLENYENMLDEILPDVSKAMQGTSGEAKVYLPAGTRIGTLVVPRDGFRLSNLEDWQELIEFEKTYAKKLADASAGVLALLAELESKRIEAEAGIERYLAVVASLYGIVALENALPKSAIDAQTALDRARALKFEAMFKEKQHGRRIEELMLMFQFRKWLESRTIIGKAEQDGVFGVDTDEFLRRLDEYRKTLDDSLAFTDKLTSRKSDIHFLPAVIELPMYTVKELTASDAAPLAIDRDAMDKIGVWKHNLFENQCLNRLLTETAQVSTSLAETAIPAGVYTANGKTSEAIAVSELPALTLFNPDSFKAANSDDWFMPGDDSEPFGRDAAGELTPPVLHNLDADVRRERKRRFETFIAELNRYDDARAVLDEAIAAAKYVDSAKASLDTTNEITTYMDWRLDYIRSYHGGVSAQRYAFEKADAALQKAGFAKSRDGVEITSGDLANVVGICVKRNDVITTIPQMIVDFLFGS